MRTALYPSGKEWQFSPGPPSLTQELLYLTQGFDGVLAPLDRVPEKMNLHIQKYSFKIDPYVQQSQNLKERH